MQNIDDIIRKDTSEDFMELMRVYAPEGEFNREFITKMQNAALMSHFKYGWVADKPSTHYQMLTGFENKAFAKDKNLEHMVNVANYAMFRYMTNELDPGHAENPQNLIELAVEAMVHYNHPGQDEFYQGTDSDKSVVKAKPKPTRQHLYDKLLNSPYDFFDDMVDEHLNLLT